MKYGAVNTHLLLFDLDGTLVNSEQMILAAQAEAFAALGLPMPERLRALSIVGLSLQEAFTVRKVSFGVGVERTFPLNSPIIEKIEVERRGDVRRAKLYYLRGLRGKAAKIKEKR